MKKKYKIKIKNLVIAAAVFIAIICISIPTVNIFKLMNLGYSFKESIEICKIGIKDEILKNGYSEVIAKYAGNTQFEKQNISTYYQIDYHEYDDFLQIINNLIEKGYTNIDINNISKKYNSTFVDYLIENYIKDISNYLEYDFFIAENLERYINYFNGDYKDTLIKVNIGLDKPYYEDVNVIKTYSTTLIVNKYNMLDSDFVPNELTLLDKCSTGEHYLSIDAKIAYDKLCEASLKENMNISVNSSYRSYESQESVYNYYYELYGKSYVTKYVATPGYSEHQTGLALDIKSLNSNIFKNSKEYTWMIENSYKYGFILRYPEGMENLTGYSSEAWHFRYVGEDIAKYIYENQITYDEYYAMFIVGNFQTKVRFLKEC